MQTARRSQWIQQLQQRCYKFPSANLCNPFNGDSVPESQRLAVAVLRPACNISWMLHL